MQIAVAELIVRFLERLGVGVVFGMPGAHVLPIYDALHGSTLKTVLAKHEQGAAFMAGGHARLTGRPAACIATAGPGATNLITGVANAYADRQPLLVITGETSTYIFGKGGLQESSGEGGAIDQAALFAGITRYHKVVERTDYLGQVLNQAARALLSTDPGPVLLCIPYNVQKEKVDAALLDHVPFAPARPCAHGAGASAESLADLIAGAGRPVIVAGHGALRSGAQAEIAELSSRFAIPVATSLKAKGVVTEGEGLSLGCLGVTSDGAAFRYIADHADLLIFLGAGFNERTSHLWDRRLFEGKRIVQVDSDPAQLEKTFRADLAIHGDIRAVVGDTLRALAARGVGARLLDRYAAPSPAGAPGAAAETDKFRLIARFYARLAQRFPQDTLIFDDNIIFAQSYLRVSAANRYFPNSGVSSLGHAIPAAIGARFAHDGPIFAVLGDGGFQMCGFELMTAVNYGLPLNVVVINNSTMGLIRKNQFQLYGERYIDCDFVNPDFALLAHSFGIGHHRVASDTDLDALFGAADLERGINLIELMLDKHAFPSYLSNR